jgi:fructokinase
VEVAASPVDVVDTVGAGDTAVATILTSIGDLLADADSLDLRTVAMTTWRTIGRRAVNAAGVTCSRAGADPPYRRELDW